MSRLKWGIVPNYEYLCQDISLSLEKVRYRTTYAAVAMLWIAHWDHVRKRSKFSPERAGHSLLLCRVEAK